MRPSDGRTVKAFLVCAALLRAASNLPETGSNNSAFAPLDQAIAKIISDSAATGANVAVSKNGYLLYARGYGYMDQAGTSLVQPDSLFRVASTSKLITAVAVLHLVEQGKMKLDDAFVDVMGISLPADADPRLKNVTIRMLLNHSGGWDNTITAFWEFEWEIISNAMHVLPPPSAETLFQYTLQQPLQFDPGTKSVYGNVGYIVLGRVIESVTGQPYEDYVRTNVLAPMGIHAIRIGRTLATGRLPGEVKYYDVPGAALVTCVYPGIGQVPYPYGGETIEAIDSFGGWVASAIDLVRLWNSIEGRGVPAFLSASSLQDMTAQPSFAAGSTLWWGLGPEVQSNGTWWKSGDFEGTWAETVRDTNGLNYAIAFNGEPLQADLAALDGVIGQIASSQTASAANDLFPSYPSQDVGNAPRTTAAAVQNAAGVARNLAPGALLTIFGPTFASRIGNANSVPLPLTLSGLSVSMNNIAIPLLFGNGNQINGQIPYEVPPGAATLVVSNGLASVPVSVQINSAGPGIFTYEPNNAVAQNQDGTLNGPGNPAAAGTNLTLYTTGQGSLDNRVPTGSVAAASPLSRPLLPVAATIGGQPAMLLFAGMTPGLVGVMQVNLLIPPLPPGQYPITITVGEVASNNPIVTIN